MDTRVMARPVPNGSPATNGRIRRKNGHLTTTLSGESGLKQEAAYKVARWAEDVSSYLRSSLFLSPAQVEGVILPWMIAKTDPDRRPFVFLTGPPGTGKTYTIRKVAEALVGSEGLLEIPVNLGSNLSMQRLASQVDGQSPSVLFLNEANRAHQTVQNLFLNLEEGVIKGIGGEVLIEVPLGGIILGDGNLEDQTDGVYGILDPIQSRITTSVEFSPRQGQAVEVTEFLKNQRKSRLGSDRLSEKATKLRDGLPEIQDLVKDFCQTECPDLVWDICGFVIDQLQAGSRVEEWQGHPHNRQIKPAVDIAATIIMADRGHGKVKSPLEAVAESLRLVLHRMQPTTKHPSFSQSRVAKLRDPAVVKKAVEAEIKRLLDEWRARC